MYANDINLRGNICTAVVIYSEFYGWTIWQWLPHELPFQESRSIKTGKALRFIHTERMGILNTFTYKGKDNIIPLETRDTAEKSERTVSASRTHSESSITARFICAFRRLFNERHSSVSRDRLCN